MLIKSDVVEIFKNEQIGVFVPLTFAATKKIMVENNYYNKDYSENDWLNGLSNFVFIKCGNFFGFILDCYCYDMDGNFCFTNNITEDTKTQAFLEKILDCLYGKELEYINDYEIITNYKEAKKLVSENFWYIRFVDKSIIDGTIIKLAMSQSPDAIEAIEDISERNNVDYFKLYIIDIVEGDSGVIDYFGIDHPLITKEVILIGLKNNIDILDYIAEEERDSNVWRIISKVNGGFEKIPKEKVTRELCVNAIENSVSNEKFIEKHFLDTVFGNFINQKRENENASCKKQSFEFAKKLSDYLLFN